jgi:hypothetical protein
MQAWLDQMTAGYQASHLGSSFDGQLGVYLSKIGRAEAELAGMVYHVDSEIDRRRELDEPGTEVSESAE